MSQRVMRRDCRSYLVGIALAMSFTESSLANQQATASGSVVAQRLCAYDSDNGELTLTVRVTYENLTTRAINGIWSPQVADTRIARSQEDARYNRWIIQLPWDIHRVGPLARRRSSSLNGGRKKNVDVEVRVPVDLKSSGTEWTVRQGETYWFVVIFADDHRDITTEPVDVQFEHKVPLTAASKCR